MNDSEFFQDDRFDREFLIDREEQFEWLDRFSGRRGYGSEPLIISGPAGVGKTTLLKVFFNSRRHRNYFEHGAPLWCKVTPSFDETRSLLEERLKSDREDREFSRGGRGWEISVIFDDAHVLSDKEISELYYRSINYKRVHQVYFLSRRPIELERSKILQLRPISDFVVKRILQRDLKFQLSESQLDQSVQLIKGLPAAAELLAKLINLSGPEGLTRILGGHLYDLQQTESGLVLPDTNPRLITVQNQLALDLKKCPDDLHKIKPRDFEELIAELLSDMGLEVKLTPATSDGGRDILAFMHSGIGKHLCLVEAKKYREDRKVGIGLVRSLYGVLTDEHANSAMMVTTSSFTTPAQNFQKKYQYRLQLREYGDVVEWLEGYGSGRRSPFRDSNQQASGEFC
ncbi:MAG TPA: restriction endonuclease [Planctomicrobium sp.]|nr:restriction endonuclease [Planctomicrobium sp.]